MRKEPIIAEYADLAPARNKMKQGVMYISEKYLSATHLCLCGCGIEAALPLGEFGWDMLKSTKGLTVIPSIQQRFECRSHYIITDGVANFV